jgi:hypothetical protein
MKLVSTILVLVTLLAAGAHDAQAQWTKCTAVPGDNTVGSGSQLIYLAVNGARLFAPRPGGLDSIFYTDNSGGAWNVGRVPPWNVAGTNYYPTVTGTWVNGGVILASGSVSQGNIFWRSTDNGVTWSASSSGMSTSSLDPTPKLITASGTTLYAGTGASGIYLSTDNGVTWTPARTGLPTFLISTLTAYVNIYSLATIGNDVFAGLGGDLSGHRFGLRHATLGGTAWDSLGTGLPANVTVEALLAVGSTLYARVGFVAGNPLYKSTDLGATWTNTTNGLPPGVNPIIGAQRLFAVGNTIFADAGPTVDVSTNGGGSWAAMNSTGLPSNYYVNGYAVVGSTMFITAVDMTTLPATTAVWKRALSELTDVRAAAPTVATAYALAQNYPNPFNPSTVIRYELPADSYVTLRVFDVCGREVAELVNGRRGAGAYEAKFDGSGLASGVYFYRLSAGNFVQTRRLLLLK